eukprot:Skav225097  [mRNA]  locus=scaffold621:328757:336722:- [translate_table: standard]
MTSAGPESSAASAAPSVSAVGATGGPRRGKAPPAPASLEVGPSTIFDARPSLVDPVAQHLGKGHSAAHMELEVRLGIWAQQTQALGSPACILKPSRSDKSFQRIELPVSTEALLIPKIYVKLMKKLDTLRREQHLECSVSSEQVLDINYEIPVAGPDRKSLRVSYHKPVEDEEKRWKVKGPAILKNKPPVAFEVLDLFGGKAVPEKGPNFDLRVALSAEIAVKDMPKPSTHRVVLKREKHRKSYDFRAWRIDFTTVQSLTGDHSVEQKPTVTYEAPGTTREPVAGGTGTGYADPAEESGSQDGQQAAPAVP